MTRQSAFHKCPMFIPLSFCQVRNLCYMVGRREKIRRQLYRLKEHIFHRQAKLAHAGDVGRPGTRDYSFVMDAHKLPKEESFYDQYDQILNVALRAEDTARFQEMTLLRGERKHDRERIKARVRRQGSKESGLPDKQKEAARSVPSDSTKLRLLTEGKLNSPKRTTRNSESTALDIMDEVDSVKRNLADEWDSSKKDCHQGKGRRRGRPRKEEVNDSDSVASSEAPSERRSLRIRSPVRDLLDLDAGRKLPRRSAKGDQPPQPSTEKATSEASSNENISEKGKLDTNSDAAEVSPKYLEWMEDTPKRALRGSETPLLDGLGPEIRIKRSPRRPEPVSPGRGSELKSDNSQEDQSTSKEIEDIENKPRRSLRAREKAEKSPTRDAEQEDVNSKSGATQTCRNTDSQSDKNTKQQYVQVSVDEASGKISLRLKNHNDSKQLSDISAFKDVLTSATRSREKKHRLSLQKKPHKMRTSDRILNLKINGLTSPDQLVVSQSIKDKVHSRLQRSTENSLLRNGMLKASQLERVMNGRNLKDDSIDQALDVLAKENTHPVLPDSVVAPTGSPHASPRSFNNCNGNVPSRQALSPSRISRHHSRHHVGIRQRSGSVSSRDSSPEHENNLVARRPCRSVRRRTHHKMQLERKLRRSFSLSQTVENDADSESEPSTLNVVDSDADYVPSDQVSEGSNNSRVRTRRSAANLGMDDTSRDSFSSLCRSDIKQKRTTTS